MDLRFEFGRNWEDFSLSRLDDERLKAASESIRRLLGPEQISGRSFLDIGCGSGLFSIAAAICGASRVVGFDFDSKAVEVSRMNAKRFSSFLAPSSKVEFLTGDILDKPFLGRLGTFDIVYAWGSLHHTGNMIKAISHAASLVEQKAGLLVIAIYNKHWSSPLWGHVKQLYNISGPCARSVLEFTLGRLMFLGVLALTGKNPLGKARGMDFWYDVTDWLGGYPYEYATPDSIVGLLEPMGFKTLQALKPRVPTGCNEFIFQRVTSC